MLGLQPSGAGSIPASGSKMSKKEKCLRSRIERLESIVTRIFRLMNDRDNWENFKIHQLEWGIYAKEFGIDI